MNLTINKKTQTPFIFCFLLLITGTLLIPYDWIHPFDVFTSRAVFFFISIFFTSIILSFFILYFPAILRLNVFDLVLASYFVYLIFRTNNNTFYEKHFYCLLFLGYFIFYLFVKFLWVKFSHEKVFTALSRIIFLYVIAQVIYGCLQLADFSPSNSAYFKLTGTFTNPATFSGILTILLPYLFYLAFKAKNKPYANLIWAVILCTLFLIIKSAARTSYIIALILILLFAYNKYASSAKSFLNKFNPAKLLFVLSGILLIFLVFLFLWKKDSALGRLFIWDLSLKSFLKAPMFGHGLGFVRSHFNLQQSDYFNNNPLGVEGFAAYSGNITSTYNFFIEVLVEQGIIGLLFLSYLILKAIRLSTEHSLKNKESLKIIGLLLTALMLQGLTTYILNAIESQMILLTSLAILSANQNHNEKPKSFVYKLAPYSVWCCSLLFMALFFSTMKCSRCV